MAIGVADHRAPDPRARRHLRHRRQHRPGLEDRAVVPWTQRREVVHHPAAVEARVVGETPEAAQLVDGRVLTELEPEPQRGHQPVISHAVTSATSCSAPSINRSPSPGEGTRTVPEQLPTMPPCARDARNYRRPDEGWLA